MSSNDYSNPTAVFLIGTAYFIFVFMLEWHACWHTEALKRIQLTCAAIYESFILFPMYCHQLITSEHASIYP
ncbi:hypothetical protein PAUR_a0461 [Pseudoalteromonas aurantia 208]|uniref:Uncharacterized protein n=1 Tax=Pseudoalteromonas aurantia 208 TaxID=1314867 RepID=A0ABR9E824_9GAMM|nr:hypothetical protein [Pseudoalteromonas aurantia 208]